MSAVLMPPIVIEEPAGLSAEDRAWRLSIVAEKDRQIDELRGEAAAKASRRPSRSLPLTREIAAREWPAIQTELRCRSIKMNRRSFAMNLVRDEPRWQ